MFIKTLPTKNFLGSPKSGLGPEYTVLSCFLKGDPDMRTSWCIRQPYLAISYLPTVDQKKF